MLLVSFAFCQVGPGAISADDIPSWRVCVLVLGQLVGFVPIPNRRIAEELAGAEVAGGQVSGGAGGSSSGNGRAAAGATENDMQPQQQVGVVFASTAVVAARAFSWRWWL